MGGKSDLVKGALDLTADLLRGTDDAATTGIRAYHGSPHDFDKFDLSKIGTGEGAQAYGHGLYFAEKEGVARGYRDALSGKQYTFSPGPDEVAAKHGQNVVDMVYNSSGDPKEIQDTIRRLRNAVSRDLADFGVSDVSQLKSSYDGDLASQTIKMAKNADALEAAIKAGDVKLDPGHMYEVNIAADPNTFLDWDKPLSEQPEAVRRIAGWTPEAEAEYKRATGADTDALLAALEGTGDYIPAKMPRPNEAIVPFYATGDELHQKLFHQARRELEGKGASGAYSARVADKLREAGIPGIKYLDAGSRGAGDGTRNYVVFDDKLISIIRKYGIAGASAMLGYNLMENLDANQAQAATVADKEYQSTQPEVRGGMLPPGMEPSGEMTSRIPSASERIYDYIRENILGGDEATKGQRAETVMNIIDQTPLAVGPMAYDVARGVTEAVTRADGGAVDDDITDALRIAKADGGILSRAVKKLLGPSERKGLMELTEPGAGYIAPKGKPGIVKLPNIGEAEAKPIPQLMDTADKYMAARGIPGGHEISAYPELDEAFAMRVAEAYDRMKHAPDDPEVRRSYDAMAQETIDQLKAAKDAGIDFTAIRGADPYAASPSLGYADIAERGNLYFFPTDAGFGTSIDFDPSSSPMLKRIGRVGDLDNATVNDAFRIVHDLYGHYGPGNPFFRAPGEERAYLLHRRMYSPEALPAMTSETRGQNSWLNYGPHGERNRKATSEDTTFADQKTGIMEPWTYLERADGGAVNDALRIVKDVGGGTAPQVMMEDAKGNKYDAKGNLIPPTNPGPNPARNDNQVAFNLPPENYETEVKPFIEQAVMPMDRPGMTGDPDLVDVMRIATQVAASGQPTETRGEQNWGRKRAEAVRSMVGADPEGYRSEYRGPFTYNAGDTANYVNTLLDFVAVPEILHDIPYEAGRTGDYTNAAIEGGLNAALTAPGLSALGAAGKAGMNYVRRNPKTVAGIAGLGYMASPEEAEAGPERWFSKLYRAAEAIPMPRMTGEQALAILRKSAPAEELRWTGTDAFLSGQKTVSKDDLLAHLKANQVQMKDVVFGGNRPKSREGIQPDEEIIARFTPEIEDAEAAIETARNEFFANMNTPEELNYYKKLGAAKDRPRLIRQKMIDAQIEKMGGLAEPVRYGPGSSFGERYATPGGQDYQETLLTLPSRNEFDPAKVEIKRNRGSATQGTVELIYDGKSIGTFDDKMQLGPVGHWVGKPDEYWIDTVKKRFNGIPSLGVKPINEDVRFQSSHWEGVPNVVGHLRTQILTANPPGANRPYKLYNVDEAQSDWAKAGRSKGFKDQEKMIEVAKLRQKAQELQAEVNGEVERLRAELRENIAPIRQAQNEYDDELVRRYRSGEITIGEMNRLAAEYETTVQEQMAPYLQQHKDNVDSIITPMSAQVDAYEAEIERVGKVFGPIQSAPYVTNTQAWTDLSIKKALDQAIDAGADYFTFTPGEVQAERYGLSNVINEIQYYQEGPYYKLGIESKSGDPLELPKEYYTAEELPELVGQEMAQKIISGEGKSYRGRPGKTLDKLDLRVGGEGMIDYYNNIYKKRVEKVVKEATGKKIQWEVLPAETAEGIVPRLGFRIDDDVKNAAFSTFARGGVVKDDGVVSKALALTSEV